MAAIRETWRTSGFTTPDVLVGVYISEGSASNLYATVSDTGTIFTFASNKGIIYAVVKSKCIKQANPTYGYIYVISESQEDKSIGKSPLRVISCPKNVKNVNSLYNFVVNKIVPLLM